jgi:regulator of sirC expression with transglutaminase-like and TPR domain
VYCEVAGRLSMPVRGISFPGHFLCKYVGAQQIIIDPFFATTLSLDDCLARLRETYGPGAQLDPSWLEPAGPRDVLVRVLSNLKQIYVERHDSERALSCTDRILLLQPDSPRELRDRGLLYQRLECFGAAIRDLERSLQLAPDDDAAEVVRSLLPDLQRQASLVQ